MTATEELILPPISSASALQPPHHRNGGRSPKPMSRTLQRTLGIVRNSPDIKRKAAWPGDKSKLAKEDRQESMDCSESIADSSKHVIKIGDLAMFNVMKLPDSSRHQKMKNKDTDAEPNQSDTLSMMISSPPTTRSRGKLRVRLPEIKFNGEKRDNGKSWKNVVGKGLSKGSPSGSEPVVSGYLNITGRLTLKPRKSGTFTRSSSFDNYINTKGNQTQGKDSRRSVNHKPYCVPRRRSSLSADPDLQSARNFQNGDSSNHQSPPQSDSDNTNSTPKTKAPVKSKTKPSEQKATEETVRKRAEKLSHLDLSNYTSVFVNNDSFEGATATNTDSVNNGKRTVRFNITKEVFEYDRHGALARQEKHAKQVKIPNK